MPPVGASAMVKPFMIVCCRQWLRPWRMHKGRWQHGCLYAKHVFVRVDGEGEQAQVRVALLDFEKCRQRLSSRRAAAHDLKQLRRHSSWNDADWQKLYYFYKTVFGSPIKGL